MYWYLQVVLIFLAASRAGWVQIDISSIQPVLNMAEREPVSQAPSVDSLEQGEPLGRGARSKKLTEKGFLLKLDETHKGLRTAIRAWKQQAGDLEVLLGNSKNAAKLKSEQQELSLKMKDISTLFEILNAMEAVEADSKENLTYEEVQNDHYSLMKRITEILHESEFDAATVNSKSKHSKGSRNSRHTSIGSKRSSKKLDYATKVAALQTKLRYAGQLEKLKTMRDLDIAEAKLKVVTELENTDFDVHTDVAPNGKDEYIQEYVEKHSIGSEYHETKMGPVQVSAPVTSTIQQSAPTSVNPLSIPMPSVITTPQTRIASGDYTQNSTVSANYPRTTIQPTVVDSRLNPLVPEFSSSGPIHRLTGCQTTTTWAHRGSNQIPDQIQVPSVQNVPQVSIPNSYPQFPHGQPQPVPQLFQQYPQVQGTNDISGQVLELTKLISKQVSLTRLPVPEPSVFTGDALRYPDWKVTFDLLIDQKGIPENERVYYLKKYVGGVAKEAIDGHFLATSPGAYEEARKILDERYGDPFVITNAFRNRLENWPKIPNQDGTALRKFSDFLRQCQIAMESIPALKVLNDDRENAKLLTKLPDWMIPQWGRIVCETKERFGTFPTFEVFLKFVVKQAEIACHPVTSFQAIRQQVTTKPTRYKPAGSSSFATGSSETGNEGRSQNFRSCILCNGNHALEFCYKFFSKSMTERKDFAEANKLCYGCLKPGHNSKFCRNRLTCKICEKQHPTPFHGDFRRSDEPVSTNATVNNTCNDQSSEENSLPTDSNSVETAVSHFATSKRSTLSSAILPVWVSHENNPEHEILTYAMLDTQSDTSFLCNTTQNSLGIEGVNTQLLLSTMLGQNRKINSTRVNGLRVRGHDKSNSIPLPTVFTRDIIPVNRNHIPTPDIASRWTHLQPIAHKLLPLQDCEVGLLIGYDCANALAPLDVILPKNDDGPFAQRTVLGWSIIGATDENLLKHHDCDEIGVSHTCLTYPIQSDLHDKTDETTPCVRFSGRTQVREVITPKDILNMMEIDFHERKSSKTYSREEQKFLDIVQSGIHQRDDKHYEMPLPFKGDEPELPNNRPLALKRLNSLQKRFESDQKYSNAYVEFMDNIISKGYAEKVPTSELALDNGQIYYIPHHGVFHKKKNKLRVVFNCSAVYNGESINDHLLAGPSLTNILIGVLCRFREETVAFCCDIEQMFYQFKVNENHRNYLRFLWWEKGDYTQPPTDFRMNVHLFGAVSSPSCANFALKRIASDNEEKYGPDAVRFIHRNFYVDDGLKSVPNSSEAIDLIKRAQGICSEGGVHLHKFVSNSRDVIKSLPPKECAGSTQNLDLLKASNPTERVLGVHWCIENDQFLFRITLMDKPLTRRGILSTVYSMYDPLGFLGPVILEGKLILQELCRDQVGWDEEIPKSLQMRWESWRNSLLKLESLRVQRCYKPENFGTIVRIELHHFSDASTTGYSQCSYIRFINESGDIHCAFVIGKSRVVPLKVQTIPRLELTAALISVRMSAFLQQELDLGHVTEYFWTDSRVVLGYISNDTRRFHVFVANRVQEIRNHTEIAQWCYVKSSENPADEGSRGMKVEDFVQNSTWIKGPKFLWEDISSYEQLKPDIDPDDPEVKKVNVLLTESVSTEFEITRLDIFSDWYKAKRAIAICLKYKAILRQRVLRKRLDSHDNDNFDSKLITASDLEQAELEIIRLVQKESFREDMKILSLLDHGSDLSSDHTKIRKRKLRQTSLARLDPFIDQNGILRVGGRLAQSSLDYHVKHPAILPRNSHISKLVISYFHEKVAHQARSTTVNEIRSNGYWVIGCSNAVSELIYKCVTCRKLRGKFRGQKMSDLPIDRIEPTPPFTCVGVDFFGPWYVKDGRKQLKRYGALFTCLVVRAIHIEVAVSLSTDSFINALRRFLAIRGPIRLLRSDCGTNFIGLKSEQMRAGEEFDKNRIKEFLLQKGCDYIEYKMNVPKASHMGGAWERQIRTVRNILNALLKTNSSQLDDDSLRTLMYEVSAIVNSRPLTTDNVNDPLSLKPLSPNQILTFKSEVLLPPPGDFDESDLYSRKMWRRVQHLTSEFWKRWQKEYIHNLQVRQKWTKPEPNLEVNDIVLVSDVDLPRGQWQLGCVVETFPSKDGLVRSVKVLFGNSNLSNKGKRMSPKKVLMRPVHKLVLLLKGN